MGVCIPWFVGMMTKVYVSFLTAHTVVVVVIKITAHQFFNCRNSIYSIGQYSLSGKSMRIWTSRDIFPGPQISKSPKWMPVLRSSDQNNGAALLDIIHYGDWTKNTTEQK